jgi:NAD(P)-dependent dehydrogenase (short-subunit alcohol dehydrogenase family)
MNVQVFRASRQNERWSMVAIVFGATGGIGAAFTDALAAGVLGYSRRSVPPVDIEDEGSIAAAAASVAASGAVVDLIVDATGFLHGGGFMPEKTFETIDGPSMARSFAVNAIGPALLMKHFLPLLPRDRRSVFVTLSAKVGSIGDNFTGGWYSYRASKAALNQLMHTAAIELRRKRPLAVCVAMHPGTVDTNLSAPFTKAGLTVRTPALAVAEMLRVLNGITVADTGKFLSYDATELPW